jgi:branched-chain amino acid transport system ATP-binding protein
MPGGKPQDGHLRTVGVTVEFEGLRALDAVDLELAHGGILGLIGPNGAGKTTLVNVMTGFQTPTRGDVRLGPVDLTRLAPHRLVREGVARSFQGGRPFSGLTVLESVEVAAVGSGKSRAEARELARSLLNRVGLVAKAGARASTLPYGDQRRIGVVRALATGPAFLLLDEPAAGLNEAEADELVAAIRRIRDDFGCGVLLIEHDMRVVMGLCERIHVLDYGRTISVGTPAEVRRDERVIEAYLGSGPR